MDRLNMPHVPYFKSYLKSGGASILTVSASPWQGILLLSLCYGGDRIFTLQE